MSPKLEILVTLKIGDDYEKIIVCVCVYVPVYNDNLINLNILIPCITYLLKNLINQTI